MLPYLERRLGRQQPNVGQVLSLTRPLWGVFYLVMKELSSFQGSLPDDVRHNSGTDGAADCKDAAEASHSEDWWIRPTGLENHLVHEADLPMYKYRNPRMQHPPKR